MPLIESQTEEQLKLNDERMKQLQAELKLLIEQLRRTPMAQDRK